MDSTLKDRFAEHMLAEIVLQTIQDISQCIDWLKTTFLYLRVSGRHREGSVWMPCAGT